MKPSKHIRHGIPHDHPFDALLIGTKTAPLDVQIMHMKIVYSAPGTASRFNAEYIVQQALHNGTFVGKCARNIVRRITLEGREFNVKCFKKPNVINRSVYKFFRKSKAERSFLHASILIKKGFDTPAPIGFIECFDSTGLNDSYYISEHLNDMYTLHDVIDNKSFPNRAAILRCYAQLVFRLQQQNICVIDNTPGNYMLRLNEMPVRFYMVDLNRMKFPDERNVSWKLNDFRKILPAQDVYDIICNEYALLADMNETAVRHHFFAAADNFLKAKAVKQNFKRVFKFYKLLFTPRQAMPAQQEC